MSSELWSRGWRRAWPLKEQNRKTWRSCATFAEQASRRADRPKISIESFRPEIRPIADDPELESGYNQWAASRAGFNKELKIQDSVARKKGWQRHYIRGETVTHKKAPEHQTTVALSEFTDKRK